MGLDDVFAPLLGPLSPKVRHKINDDLGKDEKKHLTAILQGGGWPGDLVPTAAAVSMAESDGKTDVVNPAPCSDNDDHAVGLMQVCTINAGVAGSPHEKSAFEDWLKDPDNNAKAGYAIFQSQGWGAWATYTSGAYKNHMGQDPLITVSKNTAASTVSDAVKTVTDPLAGVGDILGKIAAALFDPSTYFRLGKGVLGGVLLILGTAAIVFVIANKASGGKVAKGAKDAAVAAAVL